MQSRRDTLRQTAALATLLASAGIAPWARANSPRHAFETKSVSEAVKALGGLNLTPHAAVTLQAPDIADNGAAVQMTIACKLPGVRRLLLLVEKNPAALVASFTVSEAMEPSLTLRTKMGETSDVYAVALMADGRALFSKSDVRVVQGGCG
ncbi:thiosulfate oxidation carrier protein SoxY [Roseateles sp.]|uniref:thiosulfate oxidation carrier protein SoxY n=1 Tax=Roseateles sp. TaxID=1971397 RepID=UPI003BA4E9DD